MVKRLGRVRLEFMESQQQRIIFQIQAVTYLHVGTYLEICKSFNSNLKCQGQTHKERVLPAEVLDLMPDFRDP